MCVLYTGLRPPKGLQCLHVPFITIRPRPEGVAAFQKALPDATHLLFTSRTAVELVGSTPALTHVAVGKKTAAALKTRGEILIASEETAEGVAHLIEQLHPPEKSLFLWPRSSSARPLLTTFFAERHLKLHQIDLYDVIPLRPDPLPDLSTCSKIIFTSPSTVNAFVGAYGALPAIPLEAIGPITKATLDSYAATPHN